MILQNANSIRGGALQAILRTLSTGLPRTSKENLRCFDAQIERIQVCNNAVNSGLEHVNHWWLCGEIFCHTQLIFRSEDVRCHFEVETANHLRVYGLQLEASMLHFADGYLQALVRFLQLRVRVPVCQGLCRFTRMGFDVSDVRHYLCEINVSIFLRRRLELGAEFFKYCLKRSCLSTMRLHPLLGPSFRTGRDAEEIIAQLGDQTLVPDDLCRPVKSLFLLTDFLRMSRGPYGSPCCRHRADCARPGRAGVFHQVARHGVPEHDGHYEDRQAPKKCEQGNRKLQARQWRGLPHGTVCRKWAGEYFLHPTHRGRPLCCGIHAALFTRIVSRPTRLLSCANVWVGKGDVTQYSSRRRHPACIGPCSVRQQMSRTRISPAILLSRTGESFQLSASPIWVRPIATALAVRGGGITDA